MKKKPKYRIVEVKYTNQSAPVFCIQKRVWYGWKYIVEHRMASFTDWTTRMEFSTIPAAESYINNYLNFKPYKKIVKEI